MQNNSNTQYLFNPLQSVQCGLGESPYWHPLEKKLYWIDIKEYTIYRYDPLNQQIQTWKLPGIIGGLAGMQSGGLIIGFEDKIACFNVKTTRYKFYSTVNQVCV